MHANIINGLILLAIIAAVAILYWTAYSRGVTDGTDSGYDGGFNAGKSAGVAEASTLIRTTRADAEQLRIALEHGEQQALPQLAAAAPEVSAAA